MKNREKNFVSAVVYVHNAEERIENFLRTIIGVLENNFEHSEIICVNDFSEDYSLHIIEQICETISAISVSVINMSYFHGLELSMNAGIDMAIGDFVFEFDNTFLDYDPSMVMEIYNKALEGYDIVSASADRKEKLSSRVFYKMIEQYSDFSYKLSTESFRVLSRRVLNRIDSVNKAIPYRKAVYASCGLKRAGLKYKVVNQVIVSADRKEKRFRSGLAVDSLILFTNMGYSFSKIMTVLMMLMSVFMTIYSIVIYVTSNPVAGWTTTILFLSITFFALFGIMTIVIKYLQLLVGLVFRRKHYSFESIKKVTK